MGTANSGRRRTPIPKGAEAEEELRRIRRLERRRERAAKRKAEASGLRDVQMDVDEDADDEFVTKHSPKGADIDLLKPPTMEELQADLMYAFTAMGGRNGLVEWGRRYPKEFYALWMKHCAPESAGPGSGGGESGSLEAMLAQLDASKETVQ